MICGRYQAERFRPVWERRGTKNLDQDRNSTDYLIRIRNGPGMFLWSLTTTKEHKAVQMLMKLMHLGAGSHQSSESNGEGILYLSYIVTALGTQLPTARPRRVPFNYIRKTPNLVSPDFTSFRPDIAALMPNPKYLLVC